MIPFFGEVFGFIDIPVIEHEMNGPPKVPTSICSENFLIILILCYFISFIYLCYVFKLRFQKKLIFIWINTINLGAPLIVHNTAYVQEINLNLRCFNGLFLFIMSPLFKFTLAHFGLTNCFFFYKVYLIRLFPLNMELVLILPMQILLFSNCWLLEKNSTIFSAVSKK